MTAAIHSRHGRMGFGSFWAEVVVGPWRADLYFESINGWRHFRLRPVGVVWIGPVLVIGQNWRSRKTEREAAHHA